MASSCVTPSKRASISERQVFECIISEANACPSKKPAEYTQCFHKFVENYDLCKNDNDLNVFFRTSWINFQRLKKLRWVHAKILEHASNETKMFDKVPSPPAEPSKKKRKSFQGLGDRMQRERTDPLLKIIRDFVARECPEMDVTQIMGYFIHRENAQSNKAIAQVGYDIFTSKTSALERSFELEEAIAMMHALTLSRDQLRLMRNILISKGIYFPTSNELLEARKKLRPVISPVLENRGVGVDYTSLIKMTITSIVSLVPKEDLDGGTLEMTFKDGCDGAGQQVVWNAKTMVDAEHNIFQYGITPLKLVRRSTLDGSTSILWENEAPNSCRTLRPLYLIRLKETNEDLLRMVIPTTDKVRADLATEGICITVDGRGYDVKVVIRDTMKDLKFKKHISGLGGADCIMCKTKQCDWTDKKKLAEGFPINRSADDTLQLYNNLVDEDGNIPSRSGDFNTRLGLTQEPMTTSNQESITVTHSYINGTTWFLKVIVIYNLFQHSVVR